MARFSLRIWVASAKIQLWSDRRAQRTQQRFRVTTHSFTVHGVNLGKEFALERYVATVGTGTLYASLATRYPFGLASRSRKKSAVGFRAVSQVASISRADEQSFYYCKFRACFQSTAVARRFNFDFNGKPFSI